MTFNEIEKLIQACADRYQERHGIEFNKEYIMLKLMEEVGEFSQAVLIYEDKCRISKREDKESAKQHLSEELADILGMTILAAKIFDIDLLETLDNKWLYRGRKHLSNIES